MFLRVSCICIKNMNLLYGAFFYCKFFFWSILILPHIFYIFTMFWRKLFAIFVFVWAIGVLVLFYLYFFVYYTSTLVITSNEDEFRWELISVRNAQIRPFNCSASPCMIPDVPPFQYRLVLHKDDFKSLTLEVDITPRSTIEVQVDFERQARLSLRSIVTEDEFIPVQVDSERVFARFERGSDAIEFRARTWSDRLDMYFIGALWEVLLRDVARVWPSEILIQTIRDTRDIHIKLWGANYIYEYAPSTLITLPLEVPVHYAKRSHEQGKYHIVTDVWSFIYTKQTSQIEFQYAFRDYVVLDTQNIIWVIFSGDEERKRNFWFEDEKGTLIVLQNPRTRERNILLRLSESVREIHRSSWEVIVISSDGITYRLDNY